MRESINASPKLVVPKYAALGRQVLAKLESAVSEQVRRRVRYHPEPTSIALDHSHEPERYEGVFCELEQAILADMRIEIEYESISSGQTHRLLDPYFVVFRGRSFYLVAWCHLRNGLRTFRVDRILAVGRRDETFTRDPAITPEEYFRHSWQVFSGPPVEVTIRFLGEAARIVELGAHHPEEQIEHREDGSVVYRVVTRGTTEISRWILSYGEQAEVLAPVELRRQIALVHQSSAALYRDTATGSY